MGYFEDLTKAFDVPLVAFGTTNGIKVSLENIDAPTSTDTPYLQVTCYLRIQNRRICSSQNNAQVFIRSTLTTHR